MKSDSVVSIMLRELRHLLKQGKESLPKNEYEKFIFRVFEDIKFHNRMQGVENNKIERLRFWCAISARCLEYATRYIDNSVVQNELIRLLTAERNKEQQVKRINDEHEKLIGQGKIADA